MDEHLKEHRFCIGEAEKPDTVLCLAEEVPEIKKVSHRITRLALLILLLVAAGFGVAYFELKKRFEQVHSEGAQGLNAVSREIETRFLSLLEEQEKIKSRLEEKIRSLEKRAADLKATIQQAEKQVTDLNASKPDKKDLESTASKIDQGLSVLQKDLAGLSQSLPRMEKKLGSETTQLAEALVKLKIEMTRLQEEIQVLSVKKIDKAIFDVRLKSEKKGLQQIIDRNTEDLKARFVALEKRLEAAEKRPVPSPSEPVPHAPAPSIPRQTKEGRLQD